MNDVPGSPGLHDLVSCDNSVILVNREVSEESTECMWWLHYSLISRVYVKSFTELSRLIELAFSDLCHCCIR